MSQLSFVWCGGGLFVEWAWICARSSGESRFLSRKIIGGEINSSSTLFENLVSAINCSAVNFFGVNHNVVREVRVRLEEPSSVYLVVHIENRVELFGI